MNAHLLAHRFAREAQLKSNRSFTSTAPPRQPGLLDLIGPGFAKAEPLGERMNTNLRPPRCIEKISVMFDIGISVAQPDRLGVMQRN